MRAVVAFVLLLACAFACAAPAVAWRPTEIHRGVNIGGWLVLEPWITPSLFEPFVNASEVPVDEWTYTAILGPEEASKRLQAHWDTWLTLDDLTILAKAGITHVRVPVGYWIVSIDKNEPYVFGSWPYLTRALGWCKQLGIKVLIDIHGVPGSQNGFDNSGRRGDTHWADLPPVNLYRTLSILTNLTQLLTPYTAANGGAVTAIELVNEPFVTVPIDFVKGYYDTGYPLVRSMNTSLDVFIHDNFRLDQWQNYMTPPNYQQVYLDTHVYHVFNNDQLKLSYDQHIDYVCHNTAPAEAAAAQSLWLITGEWSLGTTDCAKWLNGMLKGTRWEGTLHPSVPAIGKCVGDAGNDASQFSSDYIKWLRLFAETQMDVYENASGTADSGSAGWYFWNFKTESAPQWNFIQGLQMGYIPNPVTSRTAPSCSARAEAAAAPVAAAAAAAGEEAPFAPVSHAPRHHHHHAHKLE